MCGLAGLFDLRGDPDLRSRVESMVDRIVHRGPDDRGTWTDEALTIGLGSCRLAVVDLSAAGHQPMTSPTGRYVIAYNGEIYNFQRLRRDLEKAGGTSPVQGHSDTAVILAAIESWGLEEALGRFIGMFAFALWDRRDRRLFLVRDRLGVKPLFHGRVGGRWVFGSELKALMAVSGPPRIGHRALELYLRHGYVPEPLTIDERFERVPAGTMVVIDERGEAQTRRWWSAAEMAVRGIQERGNLSDREAIERVEALLRDAVSLRMIADVPVGAFLSGGIDSTVVTALMQRESSRPVQTFTVGFSEAGFDESPFAAAVARHLGTEHHEIRVSALEAQQVIPRLSSIYDEPFGDSSQIPTWLVSSFARARVTVCLSGDGGDELFGGYVRHLFAASGWKKARRVPLLFRGIAAGLTESVSPRAWNGLIEMAGPLLPRSIRQVRPGEKLHKLARALRSRDTDEMIARVVSIWENPPVRQSRGEPFVLTEGIPDELSDPLSRVMYFDLLHYLPGDLLVKMDRASMAVSLEAREPLLDHRLVELAWSLPVRMKVRSGRGKWILRAIAERHVPASLLDRPKMGFALPIGEWLRGPLRDWAESLLDADRLRVEGWLDPVAVREVWKEHLAGSMAHEHRLWAVLMFEAWLAGVDSSPARL